MIENHVGIEEYESTLDKLIATASPSLKGLILMTPYFIEPNRDDAMRLQMDASSSIRIRCGLATRIIPEDTSRSATSMSKCLTPNTAPIGASWMEDIDDPEDDHRHINHLIGLYPGRQIRPDTTPKLADAAKVSVVARRDHGQNHPAWSRVWKACMFARLLDGEAAYGQLADTLGTHIYGNLWAVHPPFQIEANFGYAAGVNEILVQSRLQGKKYLNTQIPKHQQGKSEITSPDSYLIHLLPALP
ncbi:MAG: hypothetical protein R6V56_05975 [Lentisphaeria bacterium]